MRVFSRFSLVDSPLLIVLAAALSAIPASGQNADSAKQFLTSVYEHYANHGKGIDFTGPKARDVFDSSLIALLHADQKAIGPDEVGVLDGDPICSCQDWDGIWDLKIAIQPLGDGRAKAAVSFALFAPKANTDRDRRSLEMTLVSVGGQWRIWDILDKSDTKAPLDLRVELEKEIRASKRGPKTKSHG